MVIIEINRNVINVYGMNTIIVKLYYDKLYIKPLSFHKDKSVKDYVISGFIINHGQFKYEGRSFIFVLDPIKIRQLLINKQISIMKGYIEND